jgi:hypothetical protein
VNLGVDAPSGDRCNPTIRSEQKGSAIMTQATDNELTNGVNGRWLGSRLTSTPTGTRGIFRHYAPHVDDINPEHGEAVFHTMSTSVGGNVRGELIRCVAEGEVTYEARINGAEEHGGICDIAAYTLDDLWALSKVTNDLRYEWAQITGLHEGVTWSVL